MASKIDISVVTDALRLANVPAATVTQILKTIGEISAEEDALKEAKPPKAKLQSVIVISDPDGTLAKAGIPELAGWVLQLDRAAPVTSVVDRLKEAALVFNRSPKGRKHPVKTLGETIQLITAKHLLDEAHPERHTKVITKQPTQLVIVNNQL